MPKKRPKCLKPRPKLQGHHTKHPKAPQKRAFATQDLTRYNVYMKRKTTKSTPNRKIRDTHGIYKTRQIDAAAIARIRADAADYRRLAAEQPEDADSLIADAKDIEAFADACENPAIDDDALYPMLWNLDTMVREGILEAIDG